MPAIIVRLASRNRRRALAWVSIGVLLCAGPFARRTFAADVNKGPHPEWEYADLFSWKAADGTVRRVETRQDWQAKRESIQKALLSVLGPFPKKKCPLRPQVIEEKRIDDIMFRTVEYNTQPGDRIRAYLTLPAKRPGGTKIPIVLALHGTNKGKGGLSCFKLEGHPDMEIARILPARGIAVLAPDGITCGRHVRPGEEQLDTDSFYRENPRWSIMGKLVYDAIRSIDYIETLEEVDPRRIGAMGHSLGGYWTMFTTAFDGRISVAASSCGFVPFRADTNAGAGNTPCRWARYRGFSHMPAMARYYEENRRPPFDFHEVMALAAPRPFLNVSGWQDACWQDSAGIPGCCARTAGLYDFLGAKDHFENHMFDGPHDHFEADKLYGWMERWLHE